MQQLASKVTLWFPWNGSKRWLLKDIAQIMKKWQGSGIYIDPFVGGGSVSALAKEIFPTNKQYISDANPWLVAAFQSQMLYDRRIADNYLDIDYWRSLRDSDIDNLSMLEKANRFAICLFTSIC